jgi:hypothetical protein
MEMKYGIKPNIQHKTCLIDCLSRLGRLEEAENMINGDAELISSKEFD